MLLFNYIMDAYIIHPIVNRYFKNPFYPTHENIIFRKEPLKPFFLLSLPVQLMFFIHLTKGFSASFLTGTRTLPRSETGASEKQHPLHSWVSG